MEVTDLMGVVLQVDRIIIPMVMGVRIIILEVERRGVRVIRRLMGRVIRSEEGFFRWGRCGVGGRREACLRRIC